MAAANPAIIIKNSTLNDVQGNYYNYNGSTPGERGIHELFKVSCPDAFYNSRARYPPPRCLEGTRVDILKEIHNWIEKAEEKLLWIFGPAGAGKSAVAQTIAEACADKSILAGSFFFFSGAPGRNTADGLILSIAYQLAINIPHLRIRLGEIIEADLSILYKPLHEQIRTLVIPLFTPTLSDSINTTTSPPHLHTPCLIVIDGLDECQGDDNQRGVVAIMGELANTTTLPFRFLIVSRPEPQITQSFDHLACPFRRIDLSQVHHIEQAENDIHNIRKSVCWKTYTNLRNVARLPPSLQNSQNFTNFTESTGMIHPLEILQNFARFCNMLYKDLESHCILY